MYSIPELLKIATNRYSYIFQRIKQEDPAVAFVKR